MNHNFFRKVLESVLKKWVNEETLPSIPYGDVIAFSTLSSVLLYLYRKQKSGNDNRNDIVFSVLRKLIGKEESDAKVKDGERRRTHLNLNFTLNAVRTFNIFFGLRKSSVCPHPNRSCLIYAAKVCLMF